jgi:hypothetical protein
LILGCRREWFLTAADWSDTAGLTKMAAAVIHGLSKCFIGFFNGIIRFISTKDPRQKSHALTVFNIAVYFIYFSF